MLGQGNGRHCMATKQELQVSVLCESRPFCAVWRVLRDVTWLVVIVSLTC